MLSLSKALTTLSKNYAQAVRHIEARKDEFEAADALVAALREAGTPARVEVTADESGVTLVVYAACCADTWARWAGDRGLSYQLIDWSAYVSVATYMVRIGQCDVALVAQGAPLTRPTLAYTVAKVL